MSLLQQIFKGEKKKHSLGVCIPDSSKRKGPGIKEEISVGRQFTVSGIFHVKNCLMMQGKASGGTIREKDKAKFGGSQLVVKAIQVGNKSSDSIEEQQKGALFLKPVKGKLPNVKIGDVLEF